MIKEYNGIFGNSTSQNKEDTACLSAKQAIFCCGQNDKTSTPVGCTPHVTATSNHSVKEIIPLKIKLLLIMIGNLKN